MHKLLQKCVVAAVSPSLTPITQQLNRMEKIAMATWQDVKAAADKQADADNKVLAAVADMKAKLADLQAKIDAAVPPGPSADEMGAVVDELNKGADAVTAAIG